MRMATQLPRTNRRRPAPLGTAAITTLPLRAWTLSVGSRLQVTLNEKAHAELPLIHDPKAWQAIT
jgi:hypothetical protein